MSLEDITNAKRLQCFGQFGLQLEGAPGQCDGTVDPLCSQAELGRPQGLGIRCAGNGQCKAGVQCDRPFVEGQGGLVVLPGPAAVGGTSLLVGLPSLGVVGGASPSLLLAGQALLTR